MLKSKGFTLIELLIVVTIIAILSAIGLVAYNNFLKTARDNKRQSDLKLIQSALEDYYSDQLSYPPSLVQGGTLQFVTAGGVTKTYLNKIPADPKSDQTYYYQPNNTSSSYCLGAILEVLSLDSECTLSGYNYRVTRP